MDFGYAVNPAPAMRLPLPILNFCCQTLSSTMPTPKSISAAANPTFIRRPEKLVVILGATGAGKSRLSVDLASRFSAEIINSIKIQLYGGLDITTNKIPMSERSGVPHHLLGEFDSSAGDVSPSDYTRQVPFLVGGSNSLIHAVLSGSDSDPFNGSDPVHPASALRYRWVDVAAPVLNEYLDKRVDEMFESGMLDELAEYYSGEINESEANTGIRKAIGVPEFDKYFRIPAAEGGVRGSGEGDQGEHVSTIEEAGAEDLAAEEHRVGPTESGRHGRFHWLLDLHM